MAEEKITEDIIGPGVESFLDYLEIESRMTDVVDLMADNKYKVVKHYSRGIFKILKRTNDFLEARSIADFNTSKTSETNVIIYNPLREPIYIGEKDHKLIN